MVLTPLACLFLPLVTESAAPEHNVIGRSVRGRPIVSVRFGPPDAALKVLVVGAIHGDEPHRFSELIALPLHRLPGPYPGSATRWQNQTFRNSTAFVAELPPNVSTHLIKQGTAAVLELAKELASPALLPRVVS